MATTFVFEEPRWGSPVMGKNKFWRQVFLDEEVILSGDVVFTDEASGMIMSLETLSQFCAQAEANPNSAPPTSERQYTTIYGWGGSHTLKQMLERPEYKRGFVMREADRCAALDGTEPPRPTKPRSLVSMLPKNTYFAKPLPLP